MYRTREIVLLTSAFLVSGCATSFWNTDGVAVVPNSVSFRPHGMNYKIYGLVENAGGKRINVEILGTDCEDGFGYLETDPADYGVKNVRKMGSSVPDRIFDDLCRNGMPDIRSYDRQLTDEQRAKIRSDVTYGMLLYQLTKSKAVPATRATLVPTPTPAPAPAAAPGASTKQVTECKEVRGPTPTVRCVTKEE